MKRPQYVFRPNLSDPQHRRVWALLQQVPPAKRKEFLVQSMQDEAFVKQFLYTELINLPQDELLGFDCALFSPPFRPARPPWIPVHLW